MNVLKPGGGPDPGRDNIPGGGPTGRLGFVSFCRSFSTNRCNCFVNSVTCCCKGTSIIVVCESVKCGEPISVASGGEVGNACTNLRGMTSEAENKGITKILV